MNNDQIRLVMRALAFAAGRHRDQRRKDAGATPYINHPIAVADLLVNEGDVGDADVIAAALLHDTVEDTKTSLAELRAEFGERIAGIVGEVTDDKAMDKAARKQAQVDHAPHLSPAARLVKLADKTCNLRDIADCPPADWSGERKREYFDWAGRVVDGLRGGNPDLESIFDAAKARCPA